jgi:hypothetical protein
MLLESEAIELIDSFPALSSEFDFRVKQVKSFFRPFNSEIKKMSLNSLHN